PPKYKRANMTEKSRIQFSTAWREARQLAWEHRRHLAIGFVLMVVGRVAGLVLPLSPQFLIDDVIGKGRTELLLPLAAVVAGATVVQGLTTFALSQVVSIAGQRAIAEIRKDVQAHLLRLPVRYFDSTQTGVLITRVMKDAEGVRNLVGTGVLQLVGGIMTALLAMAYLFYAHWRMTLFTLVVLGGFAGMMAYAFKRLRPIFRERNKIESEVTGRLSESLGGIRTVKVYTAEGRERIVFARGVHRLLRNIASTITGTSLVSSLSSVVLGMIGVITMLIGGRAILAGEMTVGQYTSYLAFVGVMLMPLVQIGSIGTQITEAFAGLDRIRELRRMATEDEDDAAREPVEEVRGDVVFEDVH